MRMLARLMFPALRLNTRILLLVLAITAITAGVSTLLIKSTTRGLVEDAIGDQMVMQATIAAHLVSVAERKKGAALAHCPVKARNGSR